MSNPIRLAGLYEKGLPPIVGGALDQARSFVVACECLWADEAVHKQELGIA